MENHNIIYEPHPVSPERKQELRAQGYKIIDARFKPAGAHEYADGGNGIGTDSGDQFSDKQLRAIYEDVMGRPPSPKMTRESLIKWFNKQNAQAANG